MRIWNKIIDQFECQWSFFSFQLDIVKISVFDLIELFSCWMLTTDDVALENHKTISRNLNIFQWQTLKASGKAFGKVSFIKTEKRKHEKINSDRNLQEVEHWKASFFFEFQKQKKAWKDENNVFGVDWLWERFEQLKSEKGKIVRAESFYLWDFFSPFFRGASNSETAAKPRKNIFIYVVDTQNTPIQRFLWLWCWKI